jgi:hypothetical protein
VDGVPVTAVNANAGSETRNHFLHAFLNQDEDRYTAYCTVRPCIGEGACGEALQLFKKIFSASLYVQKPPNGARIAHSLMKEGSCTRLNSNSPIPSPFSEGLTPSR